MMINVITKFMTAQLRKNVDNRAKVKIANLYCACPSTSTIFIPILVEKSTNDLFGTFFNKRLNMPELELCPLLVGILHEMGHLQQVEDFRSNTTIVDLEKMSIEEITKINLEYFNCPDEIVATSWAIGFIRLNTELVKYWNTEIGNLFPIFFKELEIEFGIEFTEKY